MSPRRPKGEGEEELLFSGEGYGFSGVQLPGLEDMLAAPAPDVRRRSPRSSMSLPSGDLRQAYVGPPPPVPGRVFSPARHSRARRYIVDTSLGFRRDDDDRYYSTEVEDFLAHMLPLASGQMPDQRPKSSGSATKRISALGSAYNHYGLGMSDDVIEEERLEKIDVATAVRMRKEAQGPKARHGRSQEERPGPGGGKGKGESQGEGSGHGCH